MDANLEVITAEARLFEHDGVQSVPLPEEFRFGSDDVIIEKFADRVVIRSKPEDFSEIETLGDFARYLSKKFPDGGDWPDVESLTEPDTRDLTW